MRHLKALLAALAVALVGLGVLSVVVNLNIGPWVIGLIAAAVLLAVGYFITKDRP